MAIMKCPRCDGGGSTWIYHEGTGCAGYSTICPSCGGLGYVTDGQAPIWEGVTVWIKCPHCEEQIKIKQYQGEYYAVKVMP